MEKASIEDHKEMGRILKEAAAAIFSIIDENNRLHVLKAKQTDKVIRAANMIAGVKAQCEDMMFAEYPELSNEEGFSIYY